MGKFVQPKVFLVGFTDMHYQGIIDYLKYTDQEEFLEDVREAKNAGISGGECLCSMFAKLCYKTLKLGKNANVKKIRSIDNNLKGTFDTSHGSVFEHANINFIVTDCSRVFTHELVRHRAGTAFSQTSGRYCRLDSIDLVLDPVLEPVKEVFARCMSDIERTVYVAECKLGLRKPPVIEGQSALSALITSDPTYLWPDPERIWIPDDSFDFDKRKKITSAIRRIAPNGQSNEIGFTANLRALRHIVQLRTARFAEWEIRSVFSQVYNLTRAMFPLLWYGTKTRIVDDMIEVYGAKSNPYDITPGDPKALDVWNASDLQGELDRRGFTKPEPPPI